MRSQMLDQVTNPAGSLAQVQAIASDRCDPGAVVSAIFETSQPFDQDWFCFPRADVADNSTHADSPSRSISRMLRYTPPAKVEQSELSPTRLTSRFDCGIDLLCWPT
jgi:hypothetical protein